MLLDNGEKIYYNILRAINFYIVFKIMGGPRASQFQKDIQGEIMKRRVSLLLMMLLALALVFALSSCGEEHTHVAGKATMENVVAGTCKEPSTYDEVIYCTVCNEEITRMNKKGDLGDHVPTETAVLENVDVVDCAEGGTCDEVVYCSVTGCKEELSRREIEIEATNHTQATKTVYVCNEGDCTKGGTKDTVKYCSTCQKELSRSSAPLTKTAKENANEHQYQANVCKYCSRVKGTAENVLVYSLNADGASYTVTGIKQGANLGNGNIFIGYHPENGKPVTAIAANAFKGSAVQRVTIGANVKEIGENAFAGCALKNVFIFDIAAWCAIDFANEAANPIGVSESFAVNKVEVAGVLVIPASVSVVNSYAFANLNKIHSVYTSSAVTVSDGAFANCKGIKNLHVSSNVTAIGEDAFVGCAIKNVYADSIASWLGISFANAAANPIAFADNFYVEGKLVSAELVIPAGTTVISPYAFITLDITSLKIPATVTSVGEGAFADCKKLASVVFENGATEIGASAFANCSALASVTLPANLETIGESAFENCVALTAVVLPDSVKTVSSKAFANCAKLESATLSAGLTTLGKAAFADCAALKAIVIGNELELISEEAFARCSSLATVTIGTKVDTIGKSAFEGCVALAAVTIPAEVNDVNEKAFAGCSAMASLTIAEGVEVIGVSAFADCVSLKSVIVPAGVKSIHLGAFAGCKALESITVPFVGAGEIDPLVTHFGYIFGAETYESNDAFVPYLLVEVSLSASNAISSNAFADCTNITTVKLPASVTSIGADAFKNCTALEKVYFPTLLAWLGVDFANYAANPLAYASELYIGEELLTRVEIPEGVTTINAYAFYGATEITEVVLSGSVEYIENAAFDGCSSLTKVTLPASIKDIRSRAFNRCYALEEVHIASVEAWCYVTFGDIFANPLYFADNFFVNGEVVTDLVIPASVQTITSYAFAGCDQLTSVTLGENVRLIGNETFKGCSAIETLTLPASVVAVNVGAFENCSALKTVNFGSVQGIADRAFANCTSLAKVTLPDTVMIVSNEAFSGCVALTEATLGAQLVYIGNSVFYGCKALAKVNVPATVVSIGAYAFGECDALASVTFANTSVWTVKGETVDAAALQDAASAAAKVKELANSEWLWTAPVAAE